tara:strand:- start:4621 stop:6333 length:1713 start_codon:yes stop_codon:yes gene_type:complete
MSFESAKRIVAMYRQSNEQRISEGVQTAYNEALMQYQNEQAALKAAMDYLGVSQKELSDLRKEFVRLRKDAAKGRVKLAAERFRLEQKNRKLAHDAVEKQKSLDYRHGMSQARLAGQARFTAAIANQSGLDSKLIQDAIEHGNKMVSAQDIYSKTLGDKAGEIISFLNENPNETTFVGELEGLEESLGNAIREATITKRKVGLTQAGQKGQETSQEEFENYRLKTLGDAFLDDIKRQTGRDDDDPYIKEIYDFLYSPKEERDPNDPLNPFAGRLSRARDIDESTIEQRYNDEVQAYMEQNVPKGRGRTYVRSSIKLPLPYKVEAFQYDLPEEPEGVDRNLRLEAAPVFEQLNAGDDTPFVLTDLERSSLMEQSPDALKAYTALQGEVIRDPEAVTLEEQLLLDDMALQRQLDLLQAQQRATSIRPQMKSPEVIRARAVELIEPSRQKSVAQLSPAQQKFYAIERPAYNMSDKDDDSVVSMGEPERFGVMLYKEMFDPSQQRLKDEQTFDDVVVRMNDNFKDPSEQMRALTAFGSRAMAFQRSQNPIVLPSGERNMDYVEAMKQLSFGLKK